MSQPYVQIGAMFLFWLGFTFLLWRRRRWLLYYIAGALGFVVLVLFASQASGWASSIEAVEARQVSELARLLGMGVDLIGETGLAIRNHVGWAVFDVGVECSGILEMAAFAGLIAFYPGFSFSRRAVTIVIGLALTYLMNLVRILVIVAIIDSGGTDWVFAAHAVFGRLIFFAGVIVIFWYLVTRPTMRIVFRRLEAVRE